MKDPNERVLDYNLPFEVASARRKTIDVDARGVFRSSLKEIMEAERKINPEAKIPRIVDVLCSLVKSNGGFRTEGIFRISASTDLLNSFRAQVILIEDLMLNSV
jgi:hypothetical protein